MDLRVDQLCSMLMRETERQAPLSPVYFESLATALVIAIFTQANARLLEAGSLYAQDECIQKALAYIEERFHSKLTRSQMAAAAHLSDFYFSRPFRRLVGFSPKVYVLNRRLRYAAKLLAFTRAGVFNRRPGSRYRICGSEPFRSAFSPRLRPDAPTIQTPARRKEHTTF
jgi:AraC family transcriptional regulator